MSKLEDYKEDDNESEAEQEFTIQRGQSAKQINKCRFCKVGLWTPLGSQIK